LLLLYDIHAGESLARTTRANQLAILRTALPLGVVLMLVTLNSNLPRYAIERNFGTRELGVFAAAASFLTGGNTVVNALGQSATPRLARYFAAGDRQGFWRLTVQLTAISAALGAVGIAGALLLGEWLLRIVYRAEFAQYSGLLVAVMIAAIPIYIASSLGYVITSVRVFDAQLPLFCVVAAACFGASWLLVPRWGLVGAPAALGVAACVQASGELMILARAFRRRAETIS
jgi:O-antigen/teichoic acid export membrane protein